MKNYTISIDIFDSKTINIFNLENIKIGIVTNENGFLAKVFTDQKQILNISKPQ